MSGTCFKCREDVPNEFIFSYDPLPADDPSLCKESGNLCSLCWVLIRNDDLKYLRDRLLEKLPLLKEDDPNISTVKESIKFLSDSLSTIQDIIKTREIEMG